MADPRLRAKKEFPDLLWRRNWLLWMKFRNNGIRLLGTDRQDDAADLSLQTDTARKAILHLSELAREPTIERNLEERRKEAEALLAGVESLVFELDHETALPPVHPELRGIEEAFVEGAMEATASELEQCLHGLIESRGYPLQRSVIGALGTMPALAPLIGFIPPLWLLIKLAWLTWLLWLIRVLVGGPFWLTAREPTGKDSKVPGPVKGSVLLWIDLMASTARLAKLLGLIDEILAGPPKTPGLMPPNGYGGYSSSSGLSSSSTSSSSGGSSSSVGRSSSSGLSSSSSSSRCIPWRRDWRTLNAAEKTAVLDAIWAVYNGGGWAYFVQEHFNHAGRRHTWSSFLPWHRAFILELEHRMQAASGDPCLALPYWDWTVPASTAAVFAAAAFGTGGAAPNWFVPNSRFAHRPADPTAWKQYDRTGARTTTGIQRRNGTHATIGAITLPTPAQRTAVLRETRYDSSPWNRTVDAGRGFRNHLEGWRGGTPFTFGAPPRTIRIGLHNLGHVWVGGTMGNVPIAPNDPVFFLHHCFVDRIWWEWQLAHPGAANYQPPWNPPPGSSSSSSSGAPPPADQLLDSAMAPFGKPPRDFLDIGALGYRYV